jgi:hypothetical protein
VRREHGEDDTAVGRFPDPDEHARREELPVVGGERAGDRGQAPQQGHALDDPRAADPVTHQGKRDGKDGYDEGPPHR